MSAIDIGQLEPREEAADGRQHLIGNIVTLRSSNEQRRTFPSRRLRVGKGEVGHVVQRVRENLDRNAPLHDPIRSAHKVGEKELANGQRLLVFLQNGVRLALLLKLGVLDPLHALRVLCESAVQRGVHRRIVDADQAADGDLFAQRNGHGGFRAHGVADQRAVLDVLLLQEALDVLGESGVVVSGIVRRVAVVAQVDRIDGSVQLAGKDSAW